MGRSNDTSTIASQDAGSNGYLASLSEDTSTKMGIMHAVYGIGAMCAPLVSTQFASLPRWSFVYLVHIGLAVANGILQAFTFKFKSTEGECGIAHDNISCLLCWGSAIPPYPVRFQH